MESRFQAACDLKHHHWCMYLGRRGSDIHRPCAGDGEAPMQRTSGAAVRSVMEGFQSENRFEILNTAPKGRQSEPGEQDMHVLDTL